MIHPLNTSLRLPVIAAPMFIVSSVELVAAQCKAGVIGSFPALNARSSKQLGEWIDRIRELVGDDAVFAVNQIVHRSNERLLADMEVLVDRQVPIVITSLGARPEINEAVHSYGGIVLHDVIHDRFARKAIEKGADGLIAVAAGAGGHAGTQSPFALVREIREWFDGPLILSGAISHGASILAAVAAGADFAYIGSAFLAAEETNAPETYKNMVVESSAEDIVYSNLFTGVHGNYLRGSIEAAGLDPENLAESDPSQLSIGAGTTITAKAWKDIWGSGQGIGTIDTILPAGEIIARFEREFHAASKSLLDSRWLEFGT